MASAASVILCIPDESEREALMRVNPWWAEGGAEYMAQLLYARQDGVPASYLRERMAWKMASRSDLQAGESITDIGYGERGHIAYDLGAWFCAPGSTLPSIYSAGVARCNGRYCRPCIIHGAPPAGRQRVIPCTRN